MATAFVWANRTFSSLKLRNYRLLWLGSASEHIGQWMETVALGWLLLQITNSPAMLGLNAALSTIPFMVFPFVGGAVADRMNRKKLLIATLVGLSLLSAIIMVLVRTHHIAAWHILVYSFLSGILIAFNHPARATITANIVDKANYANAISLDSIAVNASRLIGAPIAGLWVARYDVTGIMGMRLVGCMIAVLWLLQIRASLTPVQPKRESMLTNVKDGIRFIAKDQAILGVTLLAFIPSLFVTSYVAQLPVFAKTVLGIGPAGLGWMHFASGVGSFIGLLVLASLGDYKHKGIHLFASIIGTGIALALFAASPWMPLSFAMLLITGATTGMFTALRSTVVLLIVPDHMRGRVMAMRELAFGAQPIGALSLGLASEAWGAPVGLGIMAGLCVVISSVAMVRLKRVREIE